VHVSAADLERATEEVSRALEHLLRARSFATQGLRAAGEAGDARRAAVLSLAAAADGAIYDARLTLDKLLRSAAVDGLQAPRPVISLPA
jgi:hypothetical protein